MKKILLVDDDAGLLLLLRLFLKSNGYLVITLEQGSSVLAVLNAANPDLLILDINIGIHDGRDICREVKQNSAYDHIPVVLFSAQVHEEEAMQGCGANAFIPKPVSAPAFLQQIQTLKAA